MKAEHEIILALDERNLAHVLAALALAGLAAEETADNNESRCWWNSDGFGLCLPFPQAILFEKADAMLRKLRWVEGLGVDEKSKISPKAHHGIPQRDSALGINPFLSFALAGADSSALKTFSGQLDPGKILAEQLDRLMSTSTVSDWLSQRSVGVASWGFDSFVGSHAYDLGFSSNDEGSGYADPVYTAIELLSFSGAAFFSAPIAWQADQESLTYVIWQDRLPLALTPLAVADRIDGLAATRYFISRRGAAYGKGAAYRYFPEASLIPKHNIQ